MALIKTIQEVKALIPNFVSNLSNPASLPNFDNSDTEVLIPIVGQQFYDTIQAAYNDNTLTDDQRIILKLMQMVSVTHGYADGLALGHITISDTGAKKFQPKDTTPVAKWEFEKAQRALLNLAWRSADALIAHLYETKPAEWLLSDAYKESSGLLIKTGAEFNKLYGLRFPYITFFRIRHRIADSQTLYLKDILSESLLKYFIDDNIVTAMTQQSFYLKKALAYFTIAMCCRHDNVSFGPEGFTVLHQVDDNTFGSRTQAPGLDVDMKARASEQEANNFLNRARYEMAVYYGLVDADIAFKDLIDESPLYNYVVPQLQKSGNERRSGIFRF